MAVLVRVIGDAPEKTILFALGSKREDRPVFTEDIMLLKTIPML